MRTVVIGNSGGGKSDTGAAAGGYLEVSAYRNRRLALAAGMAAYAG